jgi:starch-binding outer membrane protein, SusD/RagB family
VLARNSQNTEALTFVNAVRASHGLDARTETNLDSIMIERDKELFCFGLRLTDQRRNNTWHLPAGTWKFLPITEDEREANPNLK